MTYAGASDPVPCPSIAQPHNGEDRDDEERQESGMAARRAPTLFPGLFQRATSGRSRVRFPQARLVNAVFPPSGRFLSKAAAQGNPDSATVTITGKVVDAACYMLHAPAATAASHKECGAACLARGVPLAIAADDGALYFPADGNPPLQTLRNARVRACGTVVERHEPMELKMPVGDKNQMVVRVEGGYKQMTIQTLEKLPLTKRRPA